MAVRTGPDAPSVPRPATREQAVRLRYASGEAAGLSNRREGFDFPTERQFPGVARRRPAAKCYFDFDADLAFAFFAFGFAAAATSLLLLRFMSMVCARLYVWMSLNLPSLSRTA